MDPAVGALVIVRPDQCESILPQISPGLVLILVTDVAKVTTLDDFAGVAKFFKGMFGGKGAGAAKGAYGLVKL